MAARDNVSLSEAERKARRQFLASLAVQLHGNCEVPDPTSCGVALLPLSAVEAATSACAGTTASLSALGRAAAGAGFALPLHHGGGVSARSSMAAVRKEVWSEML